MDTASLQTLKLVSEPERYIASAEDLPAHDGVIVHAVALGDGVLSPDAALSSRRKAPKELIALKSRACGGGGMPSPRRGGVKTASVSYITANTSRGRKFGSDDDLTDSSEREARHRPLSQVLLEASRAETASGCEPSFVSKRPSSSRGNVRKSGRDIVQETVELHADSIDSGTIRLDDCLGPIEEPTGTFARGSMDAVEAVLATGPRALSASETAGGRAGILVEQVSSEAKFEGRQHSALSLLSLLQPNAETGEEWSTAPAPKGTGDMLEANPSRLTKEVERLKHVDTMTVSASQNNKALEQLDRGDIDDVGGGISGRRVAMNFVKEEGLVVYQRRKRKFGDIVGVSSAADESEEGGVERNGDTLKKRQRKVLGLEDVRQSSFLLVPTAGCMEFTACGAGSHGTSSDEAAQDTSLLPPVIFLPDHVAVVKEEPLDLGLHSGGYRLHQRGHHDPIMSVKEEAVTEEERPTAEGLCSDWVVVQGGENGRSTEEVSPLLHVSGHGTTASFPELTEDLHIWDVGADDGGADDYGLMDGEPSVGAAEAASARLMGRRRLLAKQLHKSANHGSQEFCDLGAPAIERRQQGEGVSARGRLGALSGRQDCGSLGSHSRYTVEFTSEEEEAEAGEGRRAGSAKCGVNRCRRKLWKTTGFCRGHQAFAQASGGSMRSGSESLGRSGDRRQGRRCGKELRRDLARREDALTCRGDAAALHMATVRRTDGSSESAKQAQGCRWEVSRSGGIGEGSEQKQQVGPSSGVKRGDGGPRIRSRGSDALRVELVSAVRSRRNQQGLITKSIALGFVSSLLAADCTRQGKDPVQPAPTMLEDVRRSALLLPWHGSGECGEESSRQVDGLDRTGDLEVVEEEQLKESSKQLNDIGMEENNAVEGGDCSDHKSDDADATDELAGLQSSGTEVLSLVVHAPGDFKEEEVCHEARGHEAETTSPMNDDVGEVDMSLSEAGLAPMPGGDLASQVLETYLPSDLAAHLCQAGKRLPSPLRKSIETGELFKKDYKLPHRKGCGINALAEYLGMKVEPGKKGLAGLVPAAMTTEVEESIQTPAVTEAGTATGQDWSAPQCVAGIHEVGDLPHAAVVVRDVEASHHQLEQQRSVPKEVALATAEQLLSAEMTSDAAPQDVSAPLLQREPEGQDGIQEGLGCSPPSEVAHVSDAVSCLGFVIALAASKTDLLLPLPQLPPSPPPPSSAVTEIDITRFVLVDPPCYPALDSDADPEWEIFSEVTDAIAPLESQRHYFFEPQVETGGMGYNAAAGVELPLRSHWDAHAIVVDGEIPARSSPAPVPEAGIIQGVEGTGLAAAGDSLCLMRVHSSPSSHQMKKYATVEGEFCANDSFVVALPAMGVPWPKLERRRSLDLVKQASLRTRLRSGKEVHVVETAVSELLDAERRPPRQVCEADNGAARRSTRLRTPKLFPDEVDYGNAFFGRQRLREDISPAGKGGLDGTMVVVEVEAMELKGNNAAAVDGENSDSLSIDGSPDKSGAVVSTGCIPEGEPAITQSASSPDKLTALVCADDIPESEPAARRSARQRMPKAFPDDWHVDEGLRGVGLFMPVEKGRGDLAPSEQPATQEGPVGVTEVHCKQNDCQKWAKKGGLCATHMRLMGKATSLSLDGGESKSPPGVAAVAAETGIEGSPVKERVLAKGSLIIDKVGKGMVIVDENGTVVRRPRGRPPKCPRAVVVADDGQNELPFEKLSKSLSSLQNGDGDGKSKVCKRKGWKKKKKRLAEAMKAEEGRRQIDQMAAEIAGAHVAEAELPMLEGAGFGFVGSGENQRRRSNGETSVEEGISYLVFSEEVVPVSRLYYNMKRALRLTPVLEVAGVTFGSLSPVTNASFPAAPPIPSQTMAEPAVCPGQAVMLSPVRELQQQERAAGDRGILCGKCNKVTSDKSRIRCANQCGRVEHYFCSVHPTRKKRQPELPWICEGCRLCHSCKANISQSGGFTALRKYTLCVRCAPLYKRGDFCPICEVVYEDNSIASSEDMVICSACHHWSHRSCLSATSVADFSVPFVCQSCAAKQAKCNSKQELENEVARALTEVTEAGCTEEVAGADRETNCSVARNESDDWDLAISLVSPSEGGKEGDTAEERENDMAPVKKSVRLEKRKAAAAAAALATEPGNTELSAADPSRLKKRKVAEFGQESVDVDTGSGGGAEGEATGVADAGALLHKSGRKKVGASSEAVAEELAGGIPSTAGKKPSGGLFGLKSFAPPACEAEVGTGVPRDGLVGRKAGRGIETSSTEGIQGDMRMKGSTGAVVDRRREITVIGLGKAALTSAQAIEVKTSRQNIRYVGSNTEHSDKLCGDRPTAQHRVLRYSEDSLCFLEACAVCGVLGSLEEGDWLCCIDCGEAYHSFCLNQPLAVNDRLKSFWRCPSCKLCEKCGEVGPGGDPAGLILCSLCDRSYHEACLPKQCFPTREHEKRGWPCPECATCDSCEAKVEWTTSSVLKWFPKGRGKDGVLCSTCWPIYDGGSFCPRCEKVHGLIGGVGTIQCSRCGCEFHTDCAEEERKGKGRLSGKGGKVNAKGSGHNEDEMQEQGARSARTRRITGAAAQRAFKCLSCRRRGRRTPRMRNVADVQNGLFLHNSPSVDASSPAKETTGEGGAESGVQGMPANKLEVTEAARTLGQRALMNSGAIDARGMMDKSHPCFRSQVCRGGPRTDGSLCSETVVEMRGSADLAKLTVPAVHGSSSDARWCGLAVGDRCKELNFGTVQEVVMGEAQSMRWGVENGRWGVNSCVPGEMYREGMVNGMDTRVRMGAHGPSTTSKSLPFSGGAQVRCSEVVQQVNKCKDLITNNGIVALGSCPGGVPVGTSRDGRTASQRPTGSRGANSNGHLSMPLLAPEVPCEVRQDVFALLRQTLRKPLAAASTSLKTASIPSDAGAALRPRLGGRKTAEGQPPLIVETSTKTLPLQKACDRQQKGTEDRRVSIEVPGMSLLKPPLITGSASATQEAVAPSVVASRDRAFAECAAVGINDACMARGPGVHEATLPGPRYPQGQKNIINGALHRPLVRMSEHGGVHSENVLREGGRPSSAVEVQGVQALQHDVMHSTTQRDEPGSLRSLGAGQQRPAQDQYSLPLLRVDADGGAHKCLGRQQIPALPGGHFLWGAESIPPQCQMPPMFPARTCPVPGYTQAQPANDLAALCSSAGATRWVGAQEQVQDRFRTQTGENGGHDGKGSRGIQGESVLPPSPTHHGGGYAKLSAAPVGSTVGSQPAISAETTQLVLAERLVKLLQTGTVNFLHVRDTPISSRQEAEAGVQGVQRKALAVANEIISLGGGASIMQDDALLSMASRPASQELSLQQEWQRRRQQGRELDSAVQAEPRKGGVGCREETRGQGMGVGAIQNEAVQEGQLSTSRAAVTAQGVKPSLKAWMHVWKSNQQQHDLGAGRAGHQEASRPGASTLQGAERDGAACHESAGSRVQPLVGGGHGAFDSHVVHGRGRVPVAKPVGLRCKPSTPVNPLHHAAALEWKQALFQLELQKHMELAAAPDSQITARNLGVATGNIQNGILHAHKGRNFGACTATLPNGYVNQSQRPSASQVPGAFFVQDESAHASVDGRTLGDGWRGMFNGSLPSDTDWMVQPPHGLVFTANQRPAVTSDSCPGEVGVRVDELGGDEARHRRRGGLVGNLPVGSRLSGRAAASFVAGSELHAMATEIPVQLGDFELRDMGRQNWLAEVHAVIDGGSPPKRCCNQVSREVQVGQNGVVPNARASSQGGVDMRFCGDVMNGGGLNVSRHAAVRCNTKGLRESVARALGAGDGNDTEAELRAERVMVAVGALSRTGLKQSSEAALQTDIGDEARGVTASGANEAPRVTASDPNEARGSKHLQGLEVSGCKSQGCEKGMGKSSGRRQENAAGGRQSTEAVAEGGHDEDPAVLESAGEDLGAAKWGSLNGLMASTEQQGIDHRMTNGVGSLLGRGMRKKTKSKGKGGNLESPRKRVSNTRRENIGSAAVAGVVGHDETLAAEKELETDLQATSERQLPLKHRQMEEHDIAKVVKSAVAPLRKPRTFRGERSQQRRPLDHQWWLTQADDAEKHGKVAVQADSDLVLAGCKSPVCGMEVVPAGIEHLDFAGGAGTKDGGKGRACRRNAKRKAVGHATVVDSPEEVAMGKERSKKGIGGSTPNGSAQKAEKRQRFETWGQTQCSLEDQKGFVEDLRRCCACSKLGAAVGGRFLSVGPDKWLHVACAFFAEGVEKGPSGEHSNVADMLLKAENTVCNHCNRKGATIKCASLSCARTFHFPCARKMNATFSADGKVLCGKHELRKLKSDKKTDPMVLLRTSIFTIPSYPLGTWRHSHFADHSLSSNPPQCSSAPRLPPLFPLPPVSRAITAVTDALELTIQKDQLLCKRRQPPQISKRLSGLATSPMILPTAGSSLLPPPPPSDTCILQPSVNMLPQPVATALSSPRFSLRTMGAGDGPELRQWFRVGSVAVRKLGIVMYRRRGFCTESHIFPLGYTATRVHWSTRRLGQRCVYGLEIREFGEGGPKFCIRVLRELGSAGIEEEASAGPVCRESQDIGRGWDSETLMKASIEVAANCSGSNGDVNGGERVWGGKGTGTTTVMSGSGWQREGSLSLGGSEVGAGSTSLSPLIEAPSADAAWSELATRIWKMRRANCVTWVQPPRPAKKMPGSGALRRSLDGMRQQKVTSAQVDRPACRACCGAWLFGLHLSDIVSRVEHLPGAEMCLAYKFRHREEPERRRGNPSGCARTEPYWGRGKVERTGCDYAARRAALKTAEPEVEAVGSEALARCTRGQDLDTIIETHIRTRYRKMKDNWRKQVAVRPSEIHGLGLFARTSFSMNELVIEYAGELIRPLVSDIREKRYRQQGLGCYFFVLSKDLVLDATHKGNAARYLNHSCAGNCYARVQRIDGQRHLLIFTRRTVLKGEELTLDYKFSKGEDGDPCLCGAPQCQKYLS